MGGEGEGREKQVPLIRERQCVLVLATWRLSMPVYIQVSFPMSSMLGPGLSYYRRRFQSVGSDLNRDCPIVGEGNGNPLQYSCLEIPWIEEPGGLQSVGLQRVGHDLAINPPPLGITGLGFIYLASPLSL